MSKVTKTNRLFIESDKMFLTIADLSAQTGSKALKKVTQGRPKYSKLCKQYTQNDIVLRHRAQGQSQVSSHIFCRSGSAA